MFQMRPGDSMVGSKTTVNPNVWYHVVITKTDQAVTMYVNGDEEARGPAPAHFSDDPKR